MVHYKRLALAGLAFGVACLAALAAVAGSASLLMVEVLTACIGFGTGTTFPICTVSVQNAVDRAHLGVATGVLAFLRSLGGALGVAAVGAVALSYGLPLGGEGATVTAAGASGTAFAMIFVAATVFLAAAFLMLLVMPEKPLRGSARDERVMVPE